MLYKMVEEDSGKLCYKVRANGDSCWSQKTQHPIVKDKEGIQKLVERMRKYNEAHGKPTKVLLVEVVEPGKTQANPILPKGDSAVHPLCMSCRKLCKQYASATIYQCPQYQEEFEE